MSPALAGGFLTTAPPGKSQEDFFTQLERGLFLFSFFNLFILKFYLFIYFGCVGSSLLRAGFSLVAARGVTFHCGARASHCGGFSGCGVQALGTWASVAVARGLSSSGSWALEHRLSSSGACA